MTTFWRHEQIYSRGAQSITTATTIGEPEGMRTGYTSGACLDFTINFHHKHSIFPTNCARVSKDRVIQNCCGELINYAVRIAREFSSFRELFTGMNCLYRLISNRISRFCFRPTWPTLQLSLVHRLFFALRTRIGFTVLSQLHVYSDLGVIDLVLSLNSPFQNLQRKWEKAFSATTSGIA